ncbi:hypothetical protein RHCRD62_40073 [Rhodococcus sp. RD6.2]|nr:hypothetical protein RHCRD62_40073 [Rhodococcus sp. RD6.2]
MATGCTDPLRHHWPTTLQHNSVLDIDRRRTGPGRGNYRPHAQASERTHQREPALHVRSIVIRTRIRLRRSPIVPTADMNGSRTGTRSL